MSLLLSLWAASEAAVEEAVVEVNPIRNLTTVAVEEEVVVAVEVEGRAKTADPEAAEGAGRVPGPVDKATIQTEIS